MKTIAPAARSRHAAAAVLLAITASLALTAAACLRGGDEAPRPSGAGLITRIAQETDAAIDAAP